MNVISLKDYAKNNNVTYEAVRQQVIRYKNELGSHIIVDGRQQFLDEEAVAFLDAKRQKNPVVIVQQDKDELIEALRQEKETLLVKIAAQADKIAALEGWKGDNAIAIAEANHRQALLEAGEKQIKALESKVGEVEKKASEDVQKARRELKSSEDENHLLKQQIASMKKASLWQRIRGWKDKKIIED